MCFKSYAYPSDTVYSVKLSISSSCIICSNRTGVIARPNLCLVASHANTQLHMSKVLQGCEKIRCATCAEVATRVADAGRSLVRHQP